MSLLLVFMLRWFMCFVFMSRSRLLLVRGIRFVPVFLGVMTMGSLFLQTITITGGEFDAAHQSCRKKEGSYVAEAG